MPNILITGITGFIGSHLAEHLSTNPKNNIYGLYRSIKPESPFNALKLSDKENINLILGKVEVNDIKEILSDYHINQVYHLAAKVIVKNASITPVVTYITNILGTINVLEATRLISTQKNKKIPTFVMSSDKAYGTTQPPYKEDMPLSTDDIYSSSKACQDIIARSYAYNYDLPIVVARPSNAYGIDFNWSRLVPSLAKSILLDEPLILNKGSYHYLREYTHVEDLVEAIHLLVKNIDKTKGEAYNISSSYKHTTEQVVDKFLELSNCKNKEIQFKEREPTFKEIPDQYMDITKLKSTINWKPKYNLEDGLKITIDKYKEWFDK